MADPVTGTLAAVSLGSSALGGVLGAQSAGAQAAAQSNMYWYQAGVALQNQMIEKQNAGFALQQGEQQAANSGMATRARVGQIVAAQGASGLDVNKGTQRDVVAGQRLVGNMEQTTIRQNAAKAAYDYDISAFQSGEQAQLYGAAAQNVKAAGAISEEASILGSAASVSNKWLQFSQSGALAGTGSFLSGIGNSLSGMVGS